MAVDCGPVTLLRFCLDSNGQRVVWMKTRRGMNQESGEGRRGREEKKELELVTVYGKKGCKWARPDVRSVGDVNPRLCDGGEDQGKKKNLGVLCRGVPLQPEPRGENCAGTETESSGIPHMRNCRIRPTL